jgi:hypothetical protein
MADPRSGFDPALMIYWGEEAVRKARTKPTVTAKPGRRVPAPELGPDKYKYQSGPSAWIVLNEKRKFVRYWAGRLVTEAEWGAYVRQHWTAKELGMSEADYQKLGGA